MRMENVRNVLKLKLQGSHKYQSSSEGCDNVNIIMVVPSMGMVRFYLYNVYPFKNSVEQKIEFHFIVLNGPLVSIFI